MTEISKLPVFSTVVAAWRLVLTRPNFALRTGWLPALVIFGVAAAFGSSDQPGGARPGEAFWNMITAIMNYVLLVLALVTWQRGSLPGAKLRKGFSSLRLGRAEVLAAAHVPLVGALFIPILLTGLIQHAMAFPSVEDFIERVPLSAALTALLIFPGGLVLTRAALMLVAIAEAGDRAAPLGDMANQAWSRGAGASFRLFFLLYLAVLPVVVGMAALPADLPVIAAAAVRGALLTLHVLIAGGILSLAYAALGARKD